MKLSQMTISEVIQKQKRIQKYYKLTLRPEIFDTKEQADKHNEKYANKLKMLYVSNCYVLLNDTDYDLLLKNTKSNIGKK